MRDQQHRRLAGQPQLLQHAPKFLAGELVERAERLVEQQQPWFVDQRTAEIGALEHAA